MCNTTNNYIILFAILLFTFIASCTNTPTNQKPRYVNTFLITPGLYLEKYCTYESGAGVFDTGTDYEFYLTDSLNHKLDIGPFSDEEFYDFRLRDSLLLVRKISEYVTDTIQTKPQNIVDSTVYNLKKLGFKLLYSTLLTQLQKRQTIEEVSRNMILVKGDSFNMGSTWTLDQMPMHKVILSDFYFSKYEVTQALWESIMGYNPSSFRNCKDCPVEDVDWYEVQQFITKLNGVTKNNYRLPTEAEWEYASRGGVKHKGYKYVGSNSIDSVAWYDENSKGMTHKVGQKKGNELGLFDMSGNVDEWCSDWHGDYYKSIATLVENPKGVTEGTSKIARGGAWNLSIYDARPADRQRGDPKWSHDNNRGFRLALSR